MVSIVALSAFEKAVAPLGADSPCICRSRGVAACPICLNGRAFTLGQKLDAADRAILAVPVAGEGRFRIAEVVKGEAAVNDILTGLVNGVGATASQDGKPLLLVSFGPVGRWSSLGAIGSEYAGWLRQLTAFGHVAPSRPMPAWPQVAEKSSEFAAAEWRERVALVVPYLEDPEPLVAEIAYGEFARAPYDAQRSVRAQLTAMQIAGWIADRSSPRDARRTRCYSGSWEPRMTPRDSSSASRQR